ncbi:LisH [Dictyocaulus viviparus]|uniref:LisH n=1 Tax=Dictyocaulus viviparus TaxID=29172 RepID=A0A0D8Y5Z1_DICVI|nr:LisH [Dictyocaulus viviparus]
MFPWVSEETNALLSSGKISFLHVTKLERSLFCLYIRKLLAPKLIITMDVMSFSSSELNFLIWKYLQESGMEHSAFVFAMESGLIQSSLIDNEVVSGALVNIVQRGLLYIEAEVRCASDEVNHVPSGEAVGKMSLLDGGIVTNEAIHLKRELHHIKRVPSKNFGGMKQSKDMTLTAKQASNYCAKKSIHDLYKSVNEEKSDLFISNEEDYGLVKELKRRATNALCLSRNAELGVPTTNIGTKKKLKN